MTLLMLFSVLLSLFLGGAVEAATVSAEAATMNTNQVSVRLLDAAGRLAPATNVLKVVQTEADWRKQLTPEQFRITRSQGTEAPFCGIFYDHKKPGIYYCVCCDLPLYSAGAKFDSGTGWPSFFQPIAAENIREKSDRSHGMVRTELLCVRCDAHLGHVFSDGPQPTGRRHCLNSASLDFRETKTLPEGTKP